MSAISNQATEEVFQQEGGGFLVLLTISHATLATPIRVVNNTEEVFSNGQIYIAFPFSVQLPNDSQDTGPVAKLVIDNVSTDIARVIRSIATPPYVDISVVRISDLDTVELDLPTFRLRNVQWDALSVSGDLVIDNIMQEPYPQRSFTPAEYPGLF